MSGDGEWKLIEKKQNKKDRNIILHPRQLENNRDIRSLQRTAGRTFEQNRPNDTTISKNDESSEDEDEENEEHIVLECPLVWNKFALIGDVTDLIQMLLMKFQIFPSCESGKLKEIGNRVLRERWQWIDDQCFDRDVENFSRIVNKQFVFISIIPNFTKREYGSGKKLYFVHVRFDHYFLAEEKPRIVYSINMSEYYGFLGEKPTHDPTSTDEEYVEDNKKNFMRIMQIVEGKMKHDFFQLHSDSEAGNSRKKPYYAPLSPEDLEMFKDSIYKCKLFLEDSYSGYGTILDEQHLERKIYLHNRRNCFQAFNEDIVKILVFQQSYSNKSLNNKERRAKENDIWSGRVISVANSEVKPVNKIFLCKLTFGHANLMIPICKTIPVIDVDNRYAKERVRLAKEDLIDGLKDVAGIENLLQRRVKEEKCNSFADKCFVTLKTLDDNIKTTVDRIQYVDCFKCDFIFLVIYRKWQSDFNFPFGEVVGLYTPDASFLKTLPLVAVSCDLSVVSIEEEAELEAARKRIKLDRLKSRIHRSDTPEKVTRKVFTFRYRNQPFIEIAYSYEDIDENYFKMGTHVTNVEKYVKQEDYLDRYAKKQFFTYLLPFNQRAGDDSKPHFLFPESITTETFSINKEREVSVMSFYFKVQKASLHMERESNIVIEQIKLVDEFDSGIVDEIIEGQAIPYKYLANVYKACMHNRIRRMGNHSVPPSWFYPDYTLKINLSTLIISTELEHLTNRFACNLLSVTTVGDFPVIVEEYTLHESKLQSWMVTVRDNCNINFHPTFRKWFGRNRIETRIKTIKLSDQFLEEISRPQDLNLFRCDLLFPDVCFYFYRLDSIVAWNKVMLRSDAGDSPFTVSITKPLSCFSDLLLQRLLILKQNDDPCPYPAEEIDRICNTYQESIITLTKYQKICRSYEIKEHFKNVSFMLDCVLEDVTEESIVFNHPFLRDVHHENFIQFECLGLNKVKQHIIDERVDVELQWLTRIFIIGDDKDGYRIEKNISLEDIYLFDTRTWRPNLNSTDITENDLMRIEDIKSENKYPIKLTSESSKYMDTKITLSLKMVKSQILRTQLNYNYNLGVMKIVPELLIVNPHLRVCLGHRHDPFKYFIHPDTLSRINYQRFNNINDYKEQFRILNRIEGIHQTISDRTSYFIHDVKICWLGAKNNRPVDDVYGIVLLDTSWCKERFIKLGHQKLRIQDPVNCFKEAVNKNKMEFIVCIQSFLEVKKVYWLGHAQISDVAFVGSVKMKDIHLTLKLTHSNFALKPKNGQLYSLEIMETPITARVLDRSLRKLDEDSLIGRVVMKSFLNIINLDRVHIDYDAEIRMAMQQPYYLNSAQNRALNIAINHEFSLIWGPPGTGKTMVGCIIAFAFTHINKRQGNHSVVLYCGPSNQSVDVVADKLMKVFGDKCPRLLRIYSSDVMNSDFPYPGAIINNEMSKTPEFLKPITLHHIIRQRGKPFAHIFEKYERYFQENVYRDKLSRLEYSDAIIKYNRKLKKAFVKEVESGNYEIVLCTTVGSCKKLLDSFHITQVIVDESGMCSEPESLGPVINRDDLRNTLFIGDHKQLRPIITSPAAKGKQLNLSLFERIYDPNKSHCTMLDTQYRMHPSICEFPSNHFYIDERGKLKTALCESWTGIPSSFITDASKYNGLQYNGLKRGFEAQLLKNNVKIADHIWKATRKSDFKCYPFHIDYDSTPVKEKILFIKVEGCELNQPVSGAAGHVKSKGNDLEVKAVGMLYKSLIEKIKGKEHASELILIITQYRLQEHLLKKALTEILENLNLPGPPRVSTVVKSQGSECDYVIFSTVRSLPHVKDIDLNPNPGWISKYLGFITDQNQFNVAITRAKKGLFILGNSNLLSVNQDWRSLIQDLDRRGCVIENIFDAIN